MWVLALGVVFLAVAQACIFCRLPAHALSDRLAQISNQMGAQWKEWAPPDFSAFALEPEFLGQRKTSYDLLGWRGSHSRSLLIFTDEVTMNKITEKTHRVLRVMEIKGSFSSLPLYWQWLQKTKIPEYTREAHCLPTCWGSTTLYNCSTCQGTPERCWSRRRCLPGRHSLWEARILLASVFGVLLLLGVLSLQLEYHRMQTKDNL